MNSVWVVCTYNGIIVCATKEKAVDRAFSYGADRAFCRGVLETNDTLYYDPSAKITIENNPVIE